MFYVIYKAWATDVYHIYKCKYFILKYKYIQVIMFINYFGNLQRFSWKHLR
jgi:hypothetical protein